MRILAEETTVYPDSLLSQDFASLPPDRNWWVVHTKPRQEKALAKHLLRYGIPFYLPLIPKDNLIRGRRVRLRLPLFASYIFLYADEAERVQSLTTNRIANLLKVTYPSMLHRDLRQVSRLISSDAALTVERRLEPGRRVRIKSGPFFGMEGTCVSRRGRTRLVVAVDYLLQGASVEIEDFQLEPL